MKRRKPKTSARKREYDRLWHLGQHRDWWVNAVRKATERKPYEK